jgi:iron complex outermembrane receptor protein
MGYELEFLLNRASGNFNATIGGGYTFIYPVEYNKNTHQITDTYLKYRRKHSAKLTINLTWKKFEAGLGFYAKSKILNIDEVFLSPLTREAILPGFYNYWINDNKGYYFMDGNLGYRISDKFNLSFVVKNLTNAEFMGRPGDIQPPRSFSLRFSGKF